MHLEQRTLYDLGAKARELQDAGLDSSSVFDEVGNLLKIGWAEWMADPHNGRLWSYAYYLEAAFHDGSVGKPFFERELPDTGGGSGSHPPPGSPGTEIPPD